MATQPVEPKDCSVNEKLMEKKTDNVTTKDDDHNASPLYSLTSPNGDNDRAEYLTSVCNDNEQPEKDGIEVYNGDKNDVCENNYDDKNDTSNTIIDASMVNSTTVDSCKDQCKTNTSIENDGTISNREDDKIENKIVTSPLNGSDSDDHESTISDDIAQINDDADDEIDVSDESDVVENDRLSSASDSEMKTSVRSVTFDVNDDRRDFIEGGGNYFDDIHGTEDFTFVRKLAGNYSIFENNYFWTSDNVHTNRKNHDQSSDDSSTLCESLTEKESRLIDMIEGLDWYIEDEFNNYLLDELAEPFRFFYMTGNHYTSEEDIKKAFESFGLTVYAHDCTKLFDTFSIGELEEVFVALDLNEDGLIDVEDIIREMDLLGSYIKRTDRMRFPVYDERRLKQISFPQFINFCKALDNMVYVKTD